MTATFGSRQQFPAVPQRIVIRLTILGRTLETVMHLMVELSLHR
jgi:DNA-binding HxlR family transcriptional regulator